MEKEFSPITVSGIEYESTPIKRNESDDVLGEDFITARHENTTIAINDDEGENLEHTSEKQLDSAVALKGTRLLDPIDTGDIALSSERKRNTHVADLLDNKTTDVHKNGNASSLANLTSNTHVPYVLSLYFQLLVNIILWSFMIYLIYICISTIQSDIELKIDEFTIKVLDEIANCSKEYSRNKCHLPERPSIMDEECDQLEKCQNQDPTKIARSEVTIELIAEIINAFVNRLSYKSLLVMISVLVIFIIHTTLTLDKFSRS
ncbi:hypothetical protein CANMA_001396 [Candida margitis]|uniref:uncharacterized protein n=1 Tax=Candida margitis TaxID=1775924 RepID=UPI0022260261|nr:uncharacterized protein CANMA_001396 [Candida margitis]KAI5969546.1 hypothetical protein CANMA_001396 [Candida margitis]